MLKSITNGEASNTESKYTSSTNNAIKLDITTRNVFLTAVHSDLQGKATPEKRYYSRAQANSNDKLYLYNFFSNDLGLQPDIITTRRSGRSIQGRLQQICVILRDASQSSNILEYARALRKSNDPSFRGICTWKCSSNPSRS